MGIKQSKKKNPKKKIQKADSKKLSFSIPPILNIFKLAVGLPDERSL
jgi:hypothetical protein